MGTLDSALPDHPPRMFGLPEERAGFTSPVVGWTLIVAMCAFSALLLGLGAGGPLRLAFPLAATGVGAYLFFAQPTLFLGFAWWLWFLTPEVRRLADFQGGWNAANPILLTPLLVSGLTLVTLVKRAPALRLRRLFGFVPVIIALAYGGAIGIVTTGPTVAIYSLLTWLTPVLLAFHLAARWRDYEAHKATLFSVFSWGTLVMGGYGIIQYYVAPGWDRYWLENAMMPSEGLPFPQEIRVFSTMNSSAPFAFVITAGLFLLLEGPTRFKLPMAALGLASLMLSLVRAGWLSGLLGLAYLLLFLRGGKRLRLMAICIAVALLLGAAPLLGPVAQVVGDRIDTISKLNDDRSYQDRQTFYRDFAVLSVGNPIGTGIGSETNAIKRKNYGEDINGYNGDSGIMQVPFVLGWFGSLFYVGGIVALVRAGFLRLPASRDSFVQVSRAIVLMTAAGMIFFPTLVNVTGACFWTFLGMCLAAQRYHAG